MSTETARRSRRNVLAAATAGVAAAAVASLAKPAATLGATDDPMLVDNAHTGSNTTTLTSGIDHAAFLGQSTNLDGYGLYGQGAVTATSASAGVVGNGDVGVLGLGSIGAYGSGGVVGVLGEAGTAGVGVFGWSGGALPAQLPGGVAVLAAAGSNTLTALGVLGLARFSRSGRATIGAGKSSVTVNLAGVTADSMVFAVLRANRASRWVRAAVAAAGSFTIRLNGTVSSSTGVNWIVFD